MWTGFIWALEKRRRPLIGDLSSAKKIHEDDALSLKESLFYWIFIEFHSIFIWFHWISLSFHPNWSPRCQRLRMKAECHAELKHQCHWLSRFSALRRARKCAKSEWKRMDMNGSEWEKVNGKKWMVSEWKVNETMKTMSRWVIFLVY